MLRPLLAFGALAFAAFLLAPTVVSVSEGVERLDIRRQLPWEIWKWDQKVEPPQSFLPPQCDDTFIDTYSEVTDWPERIRKNETFTMGGIVNVPSQGDRGLPGITVDLFMNETKELPGEFLGTAITDGNGRFTLTGKFPTDLQATKYHLVAHAHEKRIGCENFREHWSDPEMEVTSNTRIVFDAPDRAVKGRPTTIGGILLDEVGGPVRDAEVDLMLNGETIKLRTDHTGRFEYEYTPTWTGDHGITAEFDATEYYDYSKAEHTLKVLDEDVVLNTPLGPDGLTVLRSSPTVIDGRAFFREGVEPAPLVFTFDGIRVVACDGCEPSSKIEVEPDEDGNFTLSFVAPSDQPVGPFSFEIGSEALRKPVEYDGMLEAAVTVTLEAEATGFFDDGYEARVRAVDDAGKPAPGPIAISGPDGWRTLTPDGNGAVAFSSQSECGTHRMRAIFNGTEHHRPASADADVNVCPYMAFIPAWMIGIPWWGWLLILAGVVAAYALARHLQNRFATTITRGPPMAVAFTEPADAAAGIVGTGEAATVTAYFEEPLPDGYKVRMGTHQHLELARVHGDLSASHTVVPQHLGDVAIRAEIIDRRGRVVTRRTAILRVVKYAEEIERRHLALRASAMGDRSGSVTPREFEAWLRERAPHADADTSHRLIGIFEEADYGPRDVRREELVAYIEAERAVPEEVSQRALA